MEKEDINTRRKLLYGEFIIDGTQV